MTNKQSVVAVSGSSGYLGGITHRLGSAMGFSMVTTSGRSGSCDGSNPCLNVSNSSVEELAESIANLNVSSIVHFATSFSRSLAGSAVEELVEANLLFSIKLVEAAMAGGAQHFINVSSTWEEIRNFSSSPPKLLTPYASTKRAFRTYLDERFGDTGFVSNVFLEETLGPTDSRDKVVPSIIRSALSSTPITLQSPGNPMNFALAESLATFLLDSSNWPRLPYAFGFVSFENVTLRQIVEILQTLGLSPETRETGQPSDGTSNRISIHDLGIPIFRDESQSSLGSVIADMVRHHAGGMSSFPFS